MRGSRLAAAGLALAVGMGLASTLPAQAAQGFSLNTTQRGPDDGSTHATGSITFTGERSFRVSSTVWDSCPADGRGAYLSLGIEFMDGSAYYYPYSDAINKDTNGCDNGKISNTVTRTFSKRVKKVQLTLFEVSSGSRVYQSANSTYKDNPNT